MRIVVSSKGRIVLPADIRALDEIKPGQQFDIERLHRGQYWLVRREPSRNEGLIDWLLSCPKKSFSRPLKSKSTDTL